MELIVYSQRWGHDDTYGIQITPAGWHITHIAINGDCDPSGEPVLFENLKQDFIKYSPEIPIMMSHLWHDAIDQKFSEVDIQKRLDEIGAVIRTTEKSSHQNSGRS